MLSSALDEPRTRSSSSTSPKSSLTCSSSSPFQTHGPRNMEEVWKDLNLPSLHDHSSPQEAFSVNLRPHNPHNASFILQDFLARPTNKDPQIPGFAAGGSATLFGSPRPAPVTVLSLNSGLALDFLETRPGSRLPSNPTSNLPSFNCPFEALASSPSLGSFGKKRVNESDSSSGDRRHKRMIKNRESAARSRARKQAYTIELEREVDLLLAENARLKKQQEQLRLEAAARQLPKKHALHRTSTAPF